MAFQKATKKHARLRLALIGTSGSGKTFSALRIARGLVGPSGRIAVADTERGSASKYADRFTFDAQDMETFAPNDFVQVIQEAERGGYDCLIIDSLSHAWMGKGGALEMVDNAAKRSKSGNSFNAWREVTPEHNAMVDAIVRARCHVIVTMRAKTEYVIETNDKGRQIPRKVGLAPVQRDGLEYEFDVVGDMDSAGLIVTKTRCPSLDGQVIARPGEELGAALRAWLTDGVASSGEIRTATQSPREAAPAEVTHFERPPEKATLNREQVAKVESVATQLGGQVVDGVHGPDVPSEEEMQADAIIQEAEHAQGEKDIRALSTQTRKLKRDDLRARCATALKDACKRLGITPPPKPSQSAQQRQPGED